MSQLAIKGHQTRGEEVIALLEMLGGKNTRPYLKGKEVSQLYHIRTSNNEIVSATIATYGDLFKVYTLEEFLEKFPYKVGDKVQINNIDSVDTSIYKITSIHWDGDEILYKLNLDNSLLFSVNELKPYKEETMEVSKEFYNKYCIKCGSQRCTAEGEWLEACKHYKEETMEETIKINIPKGYEFAGVDDDNQQVVFEKIGCQYPKTYEESKDIITKYLEMDCNPNSELILSQIPVHEFCKLIVARNAYWKIAGDWKPDFTNKEQKKFTISFIQDEIEFSGTYVRNSLLAFPTKEMRDAFYENFKDLIESCKELL